VARICLIAVIVANLFLAGEVKAWIIHRHAQCDWIQQATILHLRHMWLVHGIVHHKVCINMLFAANLSCGLFGILIKVCISSRGLRYLFQLDNLSGRLNWITWRWYGSLTHRFVLNYVGECYSIFIWLGILGYSVKKARYFFRGEALRWVSAGSLARHIRCPMQGLRLFKIFGTVLASRSNLELWKVLLLLLWFRLPVKKRLQHSSWLFVHSMLHLWTLYLLRVT